LPSLSVVVGVGVASLGAKEVVVMDEPKMEQSRRAWVAGWAVLGALLTACGAQDDGSMMNSATAGTMPVAGTLPVAGNTAGQGGVAGTTVPIAGSAGVAAGNAGLGGAAGAAGIAGAPGIAGAAGMAGMAGAAGIAGAAGMAGMAGAGMAGTEGASGTGGSALPPTDDYGATGPFETTTEMSTGPGSGYTIFRPDPLGEDGFVHSPVIWGPGIFTSGATSYTTLLRHLASHGYVVMSINTLSGGPGAQSHITAMKDGLDWLAEQNAAAGTYQGKLAMDRAATMGYSLGATAAVLAADHASVMTSIAVHGHMPMANAEPLGPVLMFTGNGPSEIPSGPQAAIAALTEVPVVLALIEGQGHLTVIQDQLAQGKLELSVSTAWLRYFLNGDQAAKSAFAGDGCDLCGSNVMLTTNAPWDALGL
jgi:dienelactone hydrolase